MLINVVFVLLCTTAVAFRSCICRQEKLSGGRCCDIASVNPNQVGYEAACTCRPCRPSYVCDRLGAYLCRGVDIRTRVRETRNGYCVREPINRTIWTPYERLNYQVPDQARLSVIGGDILYIAYKGVVLQTCPRDIVCTTPFVQFNADACQHPLVIATYGNGAPQSARFAITTSAGRIYSSGCDRWPLSMFRAKLCTRLSSDWQNTSFADAQRYKPLQLATQASKGWNPFLQATHAKAIACSEDTQITKAMIAVTALPFCVGSPLD